VVKVSHARCRQCGQTRHRNAKSNLCGRCWKLRKPEVQQAWRDIKARRALKRENGHVYEEEVRLAPEEEAQIVAQRKRVLLSAEQKQEIVDLYMNSDTPVKEIASTYGVTETAPFRILSESGISWRRGDRMPDTRPGPKRELPPHIAAMQEVHVAPTPAPEPERVPVAADQPEAIDLDSLDAALRNGAEPEVIHSVTLVRWRIEFSGAIELGAANFDDAVAAARKLGAADITLVRKLA
jgi:transposase-like protein